MPDNWNQAADGNPTNNLLSITFTVAPPPTFDIRVNYTDEQASRVLLQ